MKKILIKLVLVFVIIAMTFLGYVLHEKRNISSLTDVKETVEIENIL